MILKLTIDFKCYCEDEVINYLENKFNLCEFLRIKMLYLCFAPSRWQAFQNLLRSILLIKTKCVYNKTAKAQYSQSEV